MTRLNAASLLALIHTLAVESEKEAPRTPVIDGTIVKDKASADIGDIGAENGRKSIPKTFKNNKNDAKKDAKANTNHEKLKDAFSVRFGISKRGAPDYATAHFGFILGPIFCQKSKKGIQKTMQKSMPKEYHKMMSN